MPNSSSIAAARVTVATESHAARLDTLVLLTSPSLTSGNTPRKQRINRCCLSDMNAFRLLKQGWTAAAEFSSLHRLTRDGHLGQEALHWAISVRGFMPEPYGIPPAEQNIQNLVLDT